MTGTAVLAFKAPGRLNQLKSKLFQMLPYHRQDWGAGTLFSGTLREPLVVPGSDHVEAPRRPIMPA